MRLVTRLGFVIVVISLAVVSSASHVAAQSQATTTVTRLYTGADGQSHAEDKEVAWRPAKLRAELKESESVKVTGAQFLRWPRGFVWAGHPASKRQYVIIVSGRGEVDVVGGKKVLLAPGRVLLAEDVTGKGHTTRVGPDEDPWMMVRCAGAEGCTGLWRGWCDSSRGNRSAGESGAPRRSSRDAMRGGEVFVAIGHSKDSRWCWALRRIELTCAGWRVSRGSAAEEHARAHKATSLQIQASLAGVEFYKANGFEELQRGEAVLMSGKSMPCVVMRKQLSKPALSLS